MAGMDTDRLQEALAAASGHFHRLVLVVGTSGSGKTRTVASLAAANAWPKINVNLTLAERLLDLSKRQRAVRVAGIVDELVGATGANVVVLDNIEMLFDVDLAQDPLRLFQGLSRHRTIVVAWPGAFDGTTLTYADSGHPEARRYTHPGAVVVPLAGPKQPASISAGQETA